MLIRQILSRTLTVITLAAMTLLVSSCEWRDWRASLPQGYELVHTMSNYVVICRGAAHEGVIDANVERYRVLPNAIVGYAGKAPVVAGPRKTGYFIIGLKGSGVSQGLTKEQWLAELRHLGVNQAPRMEEVPRD